MITVKLSKKDVPETYRRGYAGRKFKAYVVDKTTIPMTAGLWEGGSRAGFSRFIHSADQFMAFNQGASPFDATRKSYTIDLVFGEVVKRHSIFRGKDFGLTFYVTRDTLKTVFGVDAPAA
mgnify:CR=1 FL=1